jgi:hypothetical protein
MSRSTPWRVVYYETSLGRCPVEAFLDGLDRRARVKVLAAIDLLEEEGPGLRRPYADYLRDSIYEVRVRMGRVRYRILYFFCLGTDIVLTHSIVKESERIPEEAIERALRCREDWLGRQDADA